MLSYTFATLWYERSRYLAAVLAVAFSTVLIALQCGLLLGLISITSLPIDNTRADVWVGSRGVTSVDLGEPIARSALARIAMQPEIARAETLVEGFAHWSKPTGGIELCAVVGSSLKGDSLGVLTALTSEQRRRLSEPGAVIVDESELDRLGVRGLGDTTEVSGHRVRIVGFVHGFKGIAGPYVFCSKETARDLVPIATDQCTYLLARCRNAAEIPAVVSRLNRLPGLTAYSADGFSVQTRMHWLIRTKAGIAMGCAAVLGLLVGAVVTSQTLYAAVIASLRELAVLRAMGIPRWRMVSMVLLQSLGVGLTGVVLSLPVIAVVAGGANLLGAKVFLSATLLSAASAVTLVMALLSGLGALRSLRLVEPATLLR